MNRTDNSSLFIPTARIQFKPGYHYTLILVAILIIIVNSLVVVLFRIRRNLYRTASNHLLLSLAITDLLTGVNTFMQLIPYFEYHYFETTKTLHRTYLVSLSMITSLLSFLTVLHLCCLSIERYISIFFALAYKSIVTKGKVDAVIISVWASVFTITALQLIWLHEILIGEQSKASAEMEAIYSVTVTSLFSFIPTIGMGMLYCKLYIASRGIIRKVPTCAMNTRRKRRKEERVLVTYGSMYICFLLLSVPFFTVRFIADIQPQVLRKVPIRLSEAFYIMRTFVSLVNPFIYTFLKRDFKKSVVSVIRPFLNSRLRRNAQQKYKNCLMKKNGHMDRSPVRGSSQYNDSEFGVSDSREPCNCAEVRM